MSSVHCSSKFRARSSVPKDLRQRYVTFDDEAETERPRDVIERKQDQQLKNDVTTALYRLELDSIKPSFDVLAQTGFRHGYHLRRPDARMSVSSSVGLEPVKSISRRHSYIEPRHHSVTHFVHEQPQVKLVEKVVNHPHQHHDWILDHPGKEIDLRSAPAWYYTEPRSYSFLRSTYPSYLRGKTTADDNRALDEYRDTLVSNHPTPVAQKHHRWSVYSSNPRVELRARSTPPELYRPQSNRLPIGDRLTRRRNHEFDIGRKLAESHTDLNTFARLLDKKFGEVGGGVGGIKLTRGTNNYGVYPSWTPSTVAYTSPVYYDYKSRIVGLPESDYGYTLYSPPTRVTKPSETSVVVNPYSYSRYVPYPYVPQISSYSEYVPYVYRSPEYVPRNYVDYVPYSSTAATYRYEPWRAQDRRSYYVGSPLRDRALSHEVSKYLY